MKTRLGFKVFKKWLMPIVALTSASLAGSLWAAPPGGLASLKTVTVPEPSSLSTYIADRAAAIRLGKALFWDMQVGSDVQSCASCHFHAGADNRVKNQINPNTNGNDSTFQTGGPNHTLVTSDFPLTRHADENTAGSPQTSDSNDVISSQGVLQRTFVQINNTIDLCSHATDPVFNVGGINTRRVEPRNTPSTINAVFNFRNFWDGRAFNDFNGNNPFGPRDANAKIWKVVNGHLQQVSVLIPLSSLASQADGPPLSAFEMSCAGRTFADVGRKMLSQNLVPLGQQTVASTDSVLGSLAAGGNGLNTSYSAMIKKAFKSEFWNSHDTVTVNNQTYGQMEVNFPLYFGLAVQMYEATLIANDSPVDKYLEGNHNALSASQIAGMDVFNNQGRCIACHTGAETTSAAVSQVQNSPLERRPLSDGSCKLAESGFINIGTRPNGNDLGIGGNDPFGKPLSNARMALLGLFTNTGLKPPLGKSACDTQATADGNFKTSQLRNVELTGPYFHNGGKATLRQVVDFYNRGGDFRDANFSDLDPDITPLGLTEQQKSDLVSFLVGLTDERVRWEKAPFDHPSLCVPDGHTGNETSVTESAMGSGEAQDIMTCLPAVGAAGLSTPITTFLNLSPAAQ